MFKLILILVILTLKRATAQDLWDCNNYNQIDISQICDGYDDCGDNSDEMSCFDEGGEWMTEAPGSYETPGPGGETEEPQPPAPEVTATPAPAPPSGGSTGKCGQTPIEPVTAAGIVGGTVANPYSWPWQIQIQSTDGSGFCGGSIISNQWILTASHCLIDEKSNFDMTANPGSSQIAVGAFDVTDTNDYKTIVVQSAHTHPQYDKNYVTNDIALIKLSTPITYSDRVQPICLPRSDASVVETAGVTVAVTGWGNTISGGTAYPNKLRQVDVETFDFNTCNNQYNGLDKAIQFCAAAPGKDSCQGDSGGPLVRKVGDSWYQFGVVSFGKKCADAYAAGVYARVSNYCEWIKQITGEDLCH